MSYFPAFIKLDNSKILIIGGGNIAMEKLEKLLDFTTDITIQSKHFCPAILKLINDNNLQYKTEELKKDNIKNYNLKNYNIIIIAVDDILLQKEIFNEAKTYPNCLVNSVDSVDYCDFIFPAYFKKDDLTIAISTSGSSPALAKYIKEYLRNFIPNSIGEFFSEAKKYRKTMPKGKDRMRFLNEKAKEYIKTWKK